MPTIENAGAQAKAVLACGSVLLYVFVCSFFTQPGEKRTYKRQFVLFFVFRSASEKRRTKEGKVPLRATISGAPRRSQKTPPMNIRPISEHDHAPIVAVVDQWWGGRQMA